MSREVSYSSALKVRPARLARTVAGAGAGRSLLEVVSSSCSVVWQRFSHLARGLNASRDDAREEGSDALQRIYLISADSN